MNYYNYLIYEYTFIAYFYLFFSNILSKMIYYILLYFINGFKNYKLS